MSFRYFRKNFVFRSESSFTLVETLIVVTILAGLVGFAFVELAKFKTRHSFDLDAESLVAALSNAQSKAVQQENGSAWGVRFTNGAQNTYAIFSGATFSTSTVVTEENLSAASVYTSPPSSSSTDVVFNKLTGAPSGGEKSIAIQRLGGSEIYTITVSSIGKIYKTLE
jgi:Tfp pilus assembly protein FimT